MANEQQVTIYFIPDLQALSRDLSQAAKDAGNADPGVFLAALGRAFRGPASGTMEHLRAVIDTTPPEQIAIHPGLPLTIARETMSAIVERQISLFAAPPAAAKERAPRVTKEEKAAKLAEARAAFANRITGGGPLDCPLEWNKRTIQGREWAKLLAARKEAEAAKAAAERVAAEKQGKGGKGK